VEGKKRVKGERSNEMNFLILKKMLNLRQAGSQ